MQVLLYGEGVACVMVVSMCRVGSTRFCGDVAQVGLVCLVEVEVVIAQVCIPVIL